MTHQIAILDFEKELVDDLLDFYDIYEEVVKKTKNKNYY